MRAVKCIYAPKHEQWKPAYIQAEWEERRRGKVIYEALIVAWLIHPFMLFMQMTAISNAKEHSPVKRSWLTGSKAWATVKHWFHCCSTEGAPLKSCVSSVPLQVSKFFSDWVQLQILWGAPLFSLGDTGSPSLSPFLIRLLRKMMKRKCNSLSYFFTIVCNHTAAISAA